MSVYATASRATDLSGLPPAAITVGDLDLFVDEGVAFAQALRHAGVPTELHVYPARFTGQPPSFRNPRSRDAGSVTRLPRSTGR